jgi:hypothetical protein
MSSIDLTKAAPRSPYVRIGNYAILARSIDKCKAFLQDTLGEYMFNCPIDRILFKFKGITADEFKAAVEKNSLDKDMLSWLDSSGIKKTSEEVQEWSDGLQGRFDAVVEDDLNSF